MTKEEFLSLRQGDVVLVRGRYIRTVWRGPADYDPRRQIPTVSVTKVRRSKYNDATTVYDYSSVKNIWSKTGLRCKDLINDFERERLYAMFSNPTQKIRERAKKELAWSIEQGVMGSWKAPLRAVI